jgi:hypothetical protein
LGLGHVGIHLARTPHRQSLRVHDTNREVAAIGAIYRDIGHLAGEQLSDLMTLDLSRRVLVTRDNVGVLDFDSH